MTPILKEPNMKLLAISAIGLFSISAHADFMTGTTKIKSGPNGIPVYACKISNEGYDTIEIVKVNYQYICNDEIAELTTIDSFCSDACKIQAKRTIHLPGPEICDQGTVYPAECSVEYETIRH